MPLTAFEAVGLYVGVNLLILLVLAVRCSLGRMERKISVGDGDDPEFAKILRAHANAAEYIPAMLIALGALAAMGAPEALIHGLGVPFTFARVAHGYGMPTRGVSQMRRIGASISMLAFLIAALACLYYALV